MAIDTLLAESTIKFQTPLTLEGTEELLDYVAENLPGNVSTNSNYYTQRHHYTDDGKLTRSRGTVSIGGMITNLNKPSFDSFSSIHDSEDTSKISAIRFQTIPGYELDEHRSEVRELWSDVRTLINNYFTPRT